MKKTGVLLLALMALTAVPASADERARKIEIALQMASMEYKADNTRPLNYPYPVGNKVVKDSRLMGLYVSYTVPIGAGQTRSLAEMFTRTPMPDFVRVEGDYSKGKLDYDSYAAGSRKDLNAWDMNLRCLLGYNFPLGGDSLVVSPYTGVGFRQYSDKAGGYEDDFTQEYNPYLVRTNVLYVPLGVEITKNIDKGLEIRALVESDFVFLGNIKYNLSEIPGTFSGYDFDTGDPITGKLQNTKSDLQGGIGLRGSVKLVQKFSDFNVFTEPYIHYWRLKRSKAVQSQTRSEDGKTYVLVNDDGSAYKSLFDPASQSIILGVRMGVQF